MRDRSPKIINHSRTPVVSESINSPCLERLRALFARPDEIFAAVPSARDDDDLDVVCTEIGGISDDIVVAPSPGLVGLAEHAMEVQYWFRPRGSAFEEGDPVTTCVCALVAATFAYCEGRQARG